MYLIALTMLCIIASGQLRTMHKELIFQGKFPMADFPSECLFSLIFYSIFNTYYKIYNFT